MQADSDDDGLSDREEVLLGTDAKESDTDGDGIPDGEEEALGGDPTLFDAQPPRIRVWYADFETSLSSLESTYTVSFTASDSSGIQRVAVVKDDQVRFEDYTPGYPESASYGYVQFETSEGDTLYDGLFGPSAEVEAVDRHDNTKQITALERSNLFGHIASELGSNTISSIAVAKELGKASGFAVGAGETSKLIEAIASDVPGYLASITQIVELLDKWHLLDDLLRALPGSIDKKQAVHNPYDEHEQPILYNEFRRGWVGGYFGWMIFETVVTGLAGKAVKSSKTFAKVVDALDRDGKLTDAIQYYRAAKGTATAPVRKAGYLAARGVVKGTDHSLAASRRVLSGVRTVGRQYSVSRSLRQVDPGFVSSLSKGKQRLLGRFLAQADDAGPRIVADGGSDLLEVFRQMPDVNTKTIRKLDELEDRGVLSDGDLRRLAKAKKEGVLTNDALRRITTVLDSQYSGKWSRGRFPTGKDNFNDHYQRHVVEEKMWGTDSNGDPALTKEEYLKKAIRLANKRDGVEIFYQKSKRNIVIYDDSVDELVVINSKGEIQSLFKPNDPNWAVYKRRNIDSGNFVEVK